MSKKEEQNKLLLDIEKIVSHLLENATNLKELSDQVIAKEELEPIQKKQEILLEKLKEADEKYQKSCAGKADYTTAAGKKIAKMLKEFENLNEEFIKNLQKRQGIIQFEKKNKTKKKK